MSDHDASANGEFGAKYWEHRYRTGEPTSQHHPSPALVGEAGELVPGRALDAGCGRGTDAIWLAARGWQVTAVDVSSSAIGQAKESALAAGPGVSQRIAWVCADLTTWDPGALGFDLVTSSYVHASGPAEDLFRRLASWVAPGGTLLIAGHDEDLVRAGAGVVDGHTHAHQAPAAEHGHAHPPGSQIRSEWVVGVLSQAEWDVLVAEPRTHPARRPDGAVVDRHDIVVRARRRAASA